MVIISLSISIEKQSPEKRKPQLFRFEEEFFLTKHVFNNIEILKNFANSARKDVNYFVKTWVEEKFQQNPEKVSARKKFLQNFKKIHLNLSCRLP